MTTVELINMAVAVEVDTDRYYFERILYNMLLFILLSYLNNDYLMQTFIYYH